MGNKVKSISIPKNSKKGKAVLKAVQLLTASGTPVLSKDDRSEIAQFSAMIAQLHPSFQSQRTKEEQKDQVARVKAYLKSAPKFITERFAERIKAAKQNYKL